MPAVNFEVKWPDGSVEICYSPSTVVYEFIRANQEYDLNTFESLCEDALCQASERVKQRFGYYCSSAIDQLERIRNKASYFRQNYDSTPNVVVLSMSS